MIDFWRFNVEYIVRIYEEQPHLARRGLEPDGVPAARGLRLRDQPVQLHAIGGNLSSTPALMGNTVVWKPASTAALSAYYYMRLLQEAGLPDGVINLVFGSGAAIGDAALASPDLAGIHFTGSTAVFHGDVEDGRRRTSSRYRNYPRIVGETGGKDFILAHPSADAEAVATAIVRGSFEYQGQKCSAASRALRPVEPLAGGAASGSSTEVASIRMGDVRRLRELHGRRDRRERRSRPSGRDRGGARGGRRDRRRRRRRTTPRATSSSRR